MQKTVAVFVEKLWKFLWCELIGVQIKRDFRTAAICMHKQSHADSLIHREGQ